MSEVWFYELSREPVDAVLPGLLARHHGRGDRVSVLCISDALIDELSTKLWGVEETSFIPHGADGDPAPELGSIWFAKEESSNANGATYRYCLEGVMPEVVGSYSRLSIMFDSMDDAQRQLARERWKRFKADGQSVKFWKQNAEGRWEDQAASR